MVFMPHNIDKMNQDLERLTDTLNLVSTKIEDVLNIASGYDLALKPDVEAQAEGEKQPVDEEV